jgi:hypothetical protein
MDPGERPTDAEMDVLVAELRDAGLLTIGHDAGGAETWTLTPAGAQVATQTGMSAVDDALGLLTSLLDVAEGRACGGMMVVLTRHV